MVAFAGSANATPFIASASDFTVLGLAGGSVTINSATSITGNVGYAAGVTSTTNQKVDAFDGAAYVHSTATFGYTAATFAPTSGLFIGGAADQKLYDANADAFSAAIALGALAATHASLGVVGDNDNVIVNRVGALNVIQIASLTHKEDTLTINGGIDDVFVFNVAGAWNYDNSQIVLNGVSADNVIFNFLDSAGDVKIGKAGTIFQGTILAVQRSVDYHNPASFDGRIIAKNINLHSDFNVTATSGATVSIPEPTGIGLVAIAFAGLVLLRRRATALFDERPSR